MNESSSFNPQQDLSISNGASINDSQIAGIAGRDQNITQIKADVVNLNVYDQINGYKPVVETKSLTRQEYRQRQSLLKNVKKFWVTGVLEKSLHSKALIELKLSSRFEMVQRRHIADVEEFPGEPKLLSEETNAIQIFKQREEGETLLILGEPGSGKTTTLLRIAQDLIEQAEKDLGQFIPIVFNLSSWASERQTLADWLVKDLDSKYSVPKEVGKNWISNQELILLLDGLDEVKTDQREACVQAINEFIKSHSLTEIVVCSRMRDYEALSSRLQIQSAVCLQSLTPEQIDLYLDRAGDQLAGVKALLKEDKELQELARSPLTLSIIALAYQGISAEELPQHSSLEEHRQHLLDAYIERMFRRRGVEKKYPKAQVKYYLSWLSQHLNRSSQSIFLIERMQPSWLLSSEKICYQVGNVMTFLIVIFFVEIFTTYFPKISGIVTSTEFTLQHTILMSIAIYFPIGLFLFGFNQKEIKTFETIKSPFHLFGKLTASKLWITTKKILYQSFLYGLLYGVCFAIILGFIFWNNPSFIDETSDSITGSITGIVVGLATGAIIGIFTGFWGHYVSLSGLFFLLTYGFICLNPSLNTIADSKMKCNTLIKTA
jgi:DNA replication protein DnaC